MSRRTRTVISPSPSAPSSTRRRPEHALRELHCIDRSAKASTAIKPVINSNETVAAIVSLWDYLSTIGAHDLWRPFFALTRGRQLRRQYQLLITSFRVATNH